MDKPQKQVDKRAATQFKPGQSGNPGGKPKGARNRIQADFMHAIAEDFAEYGRKAITQMREEKPAEYIRAIASLMPKELEITRPLDDVSDEELNAAITAVRAVIAAQGAGEGVPDALELQQAP